MERNLGNTDRIVRFFLGLILVLAPLANLPPVWTQTWMAGAAIGIGAVLMVTSLVRFCPLYRVIGISTCKL